MLTAYPSQPWKPGDAITAARLEAMRASGITEIRVGPGLTMVRNGNAVSIGLGAKRGRPIPGAAIEVLVTQIGGVSGTDKTAVCTFTYDIFDAINDVAKANKLNTASGGAALALTGKGSGWRSLKLQLAAGSRGRAYQNLDGTWVLVWVDESPANEKDCT
jgi:hypothetical protein